MTKDREESDALKTTFGNNQDPAYKDEFMFF